MKNIIILGSTGSVGCNTLKVIEHNFDKFNVYALVAKNNVDLMIRQCLIFHPRYVCMTNKAAAVKLKNNLSFKEGCTKIEVLSSLDDVCKLVTVEEVDIIMSAIVGIDGLLPTFSAVQAGKQVLLANKESLVTCGQLLMEELRKNNAYLLPVDSEHNAIFQNLPVSFQRSLGRASLDEYNISRIILTASGGPFFYMPITQLSEITPKQACNHPNWSMGKKISVDSATMMNKGFEYIAARWLFNASAKQIEICLHPQSIVHSMINYIDGSMLAQLSVPDMRISIAYAMAYPERITSGANMLDFLRLKTLNFYPVDTNRYPCLQLAITAGNCSQSASIILNAANEVAVEAFLRKKIRFTKIAHVVEQVLNSLTTQEPSSIEEILWIDQQAKKRAIFSVDFFSN